MDSRSLRNLGIRVKSFDVPEKEFIRQHELGHGYQNACLFGFFMPVLCIISAVRYWLRRWGVELDYYAWWFEAQASRIGKNVMEDT